MKRANTLYCSDTCSKASRRAQDAPGSVELWCDDAWLWLPKLADEIVDLVVTDFPYRNKHVEDGGLYDTHDKAKWWPLCAELYRVLRPGRRAFLWANNHETLAPMDEAMRAAGFDRLRPSDPYEWIKTNSKGAIIQDAPRGRSHEYIAPYAKRNVEGALMDRMRPLNRSIDNRLGAPRPRLGFATAKPPSVIARLMKASTYTGELVLDPFGGSGATAIAARSVKRRSLLCEWDEETAYAISRRLGIDIVNYISYEEWREDHPEPEKPPRRRPKGS